MNPLVDEYWDSIEPYKEIKEKLDYRLMESQGYGYPPLWETIVYEHMVRAAATRITALEDPIAGVSALQKELDNGFLFVEGLCEKLQEYEGNRTNYPTIDSFFPQLITAFDRYVEKL